MSKGKGGGRPGKPDALTLALHRIRDHDLLGPVARVVDLYPLPQRLEDALPARGWLLIEGTRTVFFNSELELDEETWLGVIALALLVLALDLPAKLERPSPVSDRAAQLAAMHWWRSAKCGRLPECMELSPEWLAWGRLPLPELLARLRDEPPADLASATWTFTGSDSCPALLPGPAPQQWASGSGWRKVDLAAVFAEALVDNARRALQLQHEASHPVREGHNPHTKAAQARRWLIAHYPLLGSLLTQFELVEDAELCRRMEISIAAIQVGTGEIYLNPARALNLEQAKFVIAHEVLHAGLAHASRRRGRDPYLWNVACDFVINDWLVQMNVGTPPDVGMLYDEALRGWSAEEIYQRIAADLRLRKRLCTLRGADVDMLDDEAPGGFFTDRDGFCRRALAQGLDWHLAAGRGLLPAGLVEAIRTLAQPAIPWQAELAEWLQERFPLPERRRSYARPSRRQSATPDIPRPRHVEPEEDRATRTFGVVLDTSGSMARADLGKALGAIVSYTRAQAVREVRLVFCDAQPYDEGYVAIESLAARARVRGRGGTVLQPALAMLETRTDFPKDAPILVVTDGFCESELSVRRDHAFLLAPGGRLPFRTAKPVFHMA